MNATRIWIAAAALLASAAFAQAPNPTPNAAPGQNPNQVRHTVVAGDTLMAIAQRYLGDASLWREVQRLNPGTQNDRQLRLGSTVIVPLPPPGPVAVHVNGKATFTRAGQTKELTQGSQLQEKDSIDVAEGSYVTLRWSEGMVTHLLPGSVLKLVPPQRLANPRPQMLELEKGTAEAKVPPGVEGRSFQIRTRLGTAAVRGTGFGVRLGDTMITDVTEGAVRLGVGAAQPLELPAGSGAVADSSGRPPTAVPLLPAPQIEAESFVTTDGFVQAAAIPGASRYEFELAPEATPEAILRRVASDTPVFPLAPLREGNWRVRMRAVDGQGIPGQPGMRSIAAVSFPPPTPGTPPDNGLVGQDQPGRFVCAEVPGAAAYEIVIQSLDAQRDPIRIAAQPNCEGALPQLPFGRYRWQAYALRQVPGGRLLRTQPSAWSQFTVVQRPVTPAPAVRPGAGAQQLLSWEGTAGASYLVQVSLDTSFVRLVSETRVTAPQAAITVQPGVTVYVRVRAVGANGVPSDFSAPVMLRGAAQAAGGAGMVTQPPPVGGPPGSR